MVGSGSGIYNAGNSTINASTISGNSDVGIRNDGTTMLLSSIVAGNPMMLLGGFTSLGHNLIGDAGDSSGWVTTDLLNVDPRLGPLQDNGGPTKTMELLPGSPALDAGAPVDGLATDQRGISRTDNGPPDVGAYEYQPVPPIVDAGDPYVIHEGESLNLNAYASFGDSLTYSWDVNDDGSFTDATGVHATLSWDELGTLGVSDGPATFNVRVQVEDQFGSKATSPVATLQVLNTAPTATLDTSGPVPIGEMVTVQFRAATDSSTIDIAAGFHYAFATDPTGLADATYENSGATPYASFSFGTVGEETVYGRIIDQDNSFNDYTTQCVVYYQPGTLVVVNTDDGAGSLRDAVDYSSPGSRIVFDSSLRGQTISLTSGGLAGHRQEPRHRGAGGVEPDRGPRQPGSARFPHLHRGRRRQGEAGRPDDHRGSGRLGRRDSQRGEPDGHRLHHPRQLGRRRRRHLQRWHDDHHRLHPLRQLGRHRRRNLQQLRRDDRRRLHPQWQLGRLRAAAASTTTARR